MKFSTRGIILAFKKFQVLDFRIRKAEPVDFSSNVCCVLENNSLQELHILKESNHVDKH